jgi:hypothetical protein
MEEGMKAGEKSDEIFSSMLAVSCILAFLSSCPSPWEASWNSRRAWESRRRRRVEAVRFEGII